MIWRAGILPAGYEAWLFLPLLASVYGFCQVQAKTDDGYFLGFPSLWNVVALYLYALPFGELGLAGDRDRAGDPDLRPDPISLSLAARASSTGSCRSSGIPWTIALVWIICNLPDSAGPSSTRPTLQVAWASLIYPVLYLGALVGDQRGALDEEADAGRRGSVTDSRD